MLQLDDEYPQEEDEVEQAGYGETGGDGAGVGQDYEEYFGWLSLVNSVSEATRETWDNVFKKSIYEFFNILSYLRWSTERQKQMIEKYKRQRH